MKFNELIFLVKSDLYRAVGDSSLKSFIKNLIKHQSFKICLFYRICHYFYLNKNKPMLFLFNVLFHHYKTTYSMEISYKTIVGSGLYLGHLFGIVISPHVTIGNNVNIMQGVTIGFSSRGKYKGYPTIGDNVYIGAGAVIIGNATIGNNVAIGANSVITKDVPENAVIVGIPGKVISYNGSQDYVVRTDYQ